jgi:hypothetical protein
MGGGGGGMGNFIRIINGFARRILNGYATQVRNFLTLPRSKKTCGSPTQFTVKASGNLELFCFCLKLY